MSDDTRPLHFGRSFVGTALEDDCPCPKAPCGLALSDGLGGDPDCPEHALSAGKTMRQMHPADRCPATAHFNPATDMFMQMAALYRAPFWEDEDARITAYGHVDKAELAAQVQAYDRYCDNDDSELIGVEYIRHVWLRAEEDETGEVRLWRCEQDEPRAFPATSIWGYR